METKIEIVTLRRINQLKRRYEGIFHLFSLADFNHPVTSKTILAALENIRLELKKLIRQ